VRWKERFDDSFLLTRIVDERGMSQKSKDIGGQLEVNVSENAQEGDRRKIGALKVADTLRVTRKSGSIGMSGGKSETAVWGQNRRGFGRRLLLFTGWL